MWGECLVLVVDLVLTAWFAARGICIVSSAFDYPYSLPSWNEPRQDIESKTERQINN